MNGRYINLFRFFFAFTDLFTLNLVHIMVISLLHTINAANSHHYIIYYLVANMIWLSCGYITAMYANDKLLNFTRYARRTFRGFTWYVILMMIFLFVYHYDYSRLFVSLSLILFGVSLFITRFLFLWVFYYLKDNWHYSKKIIVLGYNDLSKKLVNYFTQNNEQILMEGYFEDPDTVDELSVYPILGNVNDCLQYAVTNQVNEIYSTISPENNPSIYELANVAEKNLIRFKFVPDLRVFFNRNFHIDYVQEIPVFSLRQEPLEDMANSIKKRLFDMLFSSFIILFILSWLTPLLALLIKITSPGPVFFVQLRSGKDNHAFRCFKFRSLKVNKDADNIQVTKNDTRYTALGKFLRKTSIDELPQFINVLLGDMSVVGPRPHMLSHTKQFSNIMDQYMIRHFVKPGITGWAQINGYRGEIKEEMQLRNRIEHDIWYLENWSIWLDIKIIFLTIFNGIRGDKNAY